MRRSIPAPEDHNQSMMYFRFYGGASSRLGTISVTHTNPLYVVRKDETSDCLLDEFDLLDLLVGETQRVPEANSISRIGHIFVIYTC